MNRLRDTVADVLIGVVVLIVAFWLLRGVFQMVIWGASLALMVVLIVLVIWIASKIRS